MNWTDGMNTRETVETWQKSRAHDLRMAAMHIETAYKPKPGGPWAYAMGYWLAYAERLREAAALIEAPLKLEEPEGL